MSDSAKSANQPPAVPSDPLALLAKSVISSSQAQQSAHDLLTGPDWITGRAPPPIDRWNPEHCGDIGMEIRADGSWWHQGAPIKRQELVRLFASILRREDDGHYYLVTPVEKVVVAVELHPLIVIDAEPLPGYTPETLVLSLNTGGQIPLDGAHGLALEPRAANAAYVEVAHGLSALFSRAAWYRLVERLDDDGGLVSAGYRFDLA